MSLANARKRARQVQQAALETGDGEEESIILHLADQVSSPILAYVDRKGLGWRPTEPGRAQRQQALVVHVRAELLPGWATQEELSLEGRVENRQQVWKISEILVQPHTWRITANRWPSPED